MSINGLVRLSKRFSSILKPRFTLPDLPYPYDALTPVISARIMHLHHAKHHATYVSNLNSALTAFEESRTKADIAGMSQAMQSIRFNGGGHLNHSIFWKNLCPVKEARGEPDGALREAIEKEFEDGWKGMKASFVRMTAAIQGSGWGWLVRQRKFRATTGHKEDSD